MIEMHTNFNIPIRAIYHMLILTTSVSEWVNIVIKYALI